MKKLIVASSFIMMLILAPAGARADLFYSQKEYSKVYNEKVAVELELKMLKKQFQNEKGNLDSKIRDLENDISGLQHDLDNLKKQMQEKLDAASKKIKELDHQTEILKQSGTDRESQLLKEMKDQQKNHDAALQDLQKKLVKEREDGALALKKQREQCQSKIEELEKTVANLNEELSDLKELNKKQRDNLEKMKSQAEDMENQLKEEIEKGSIRLKKYHNKLIINIDDKISFDSGSAELKKEILPALNKIIGILVKYPENRIVVEGHTDNVPIHTQKFKDNWHLSTARALAVLDFILKKKDLDPHRFSAAGYGEYNPVVQNDTPANRALNRRVDIVVLPLLKE